MAEIEPYASPVKNAPADGRFVAYVGGAPALMIEFFEADYHVYGARANTLDDFLSTTVIIC